MDSASTRTTIQISDSTVKDYWNGMWVCACCANREQDRENRGLSAGRREELDRELPAKAEMSKNRLKKEERPKKPKDGLCQHLRHPPKAKNTQVRELWEGIWVCHTCSMRERTRKSNSYSTVQKADLDKRGPGSKGRLKEGIILGIEMPEDGLCNHPHHPPTAKNPKVQRIWNGISVCRTCAERERKRDTKEAKKKKNEERRQKK